jgi:TIR domain-containing protein
MLAHFPKYSHVKELHMNLQKPVGPIEIFFSYAHEDETWRAKLSKFLRRLERDGEIQSWHDRDISGGKEWEKEIMTHLNTAHIILLLISQDFIDSDFCSGVELKQAMERHKAGTARVIPIIVRHSDWQGTSFAQLQALPRDGKPLSTWSDEDEALLQVTRGIRQVIKELK